MGKNITNINNISNYFNTFEKVNVQQKKGGKDTL